jgi:uncharacterized protein
MSVLSIDVSSELQLETQSLVGRSMAVLGITGSGKTNTAAVLIEELLSHELPLTIVDIEGEYWGLKERFEILVAGRSEHTELEISPENAGRLAEISVRRSIPVILDLSDYTHSEAYDFLINYFNSLWAASSTLKQPYQIILEEAHEFVPQGTNTPLKEILARIALRGRKRGLGVILISQRSAKVEKDVLTQASLLFLHKVIHPIDMKVYKDLIPLPPTKAEEVVRGLQLGEAIVINNHQMHIVHLRMRYTYHAGSTPTLKSTIQPKLRRIDESVLRELRALTSDIKHTISRNDQLSKLIQRVMELEATVVLKDAEIGKLQNQIDLLSKIGVSIEGLFEGTALQEPKKLEINNVIAKNKDHFGTSKIHTTSKLALTDTIQPDIALNPAERRKLDSLSRRVQKLPKLQRSILHLLVDHDGTAMTVPTMATWLSLKESTIRNRPPYELIKMKLITRIRGKSGYKYTSLVCSYFRKEFPQIDPSLLLRELLD